MQKYRINADLLLNLYEEAGTEWFMEFFYVFINQSNRKAVSIPIFFFSQNRKKFSRQKFLVESQPSFELREDEHLGRGLRRNYVRRVYWLVWTEAICSSSTITKHHCYA